MRRMVSDGADVYRVVVVHRKQKRNPDYVPGLGRSVYLLLDETVEVQYGPYNTLGTAKGVLTKETVDRDGNPRWGIVGGRVEKATTTWTEVDLSA